MICFSETKSLCIVDISLIKHIQCRQKKNLQNFYCDTHYMYTPFLLIQGEIKEYKYAHKADLHQNNGRHLLQHNKDTTLLTASPETNITNHSDTFPMKGQGTLAKWSYPMHIASRSK